MRQILPFFQKRLEEFKQSAIIGDVRYLGLIAALELVKDKATKQPFAFKERIGLKIYKLGLQRKLILRPLGDVIYLFLPLSVNKHALTYIFDNLSQIFAVL
jgi:adenosylmethionine-8-amino-7-oxononanoate aminotransferase